MPKLNRIQVDIGAIVYQRPGVSTFYLDINREGLRKRLSLHTNRKDIAIEKARAKLSTLDVAEWGVPAKGEIELSEITEQYIYDLERRNLAPSTAISYASTFKIFQMWMRDILVDSEPKIKDVTPDRLQNYLAWRSKQASAATANRDRRTLHALFSRAVRQALTASNPVDRTDPIAVIRKLPKVPNENQVKQILEEAKKPIPLLGPGRKGNGNTRPSNGNVHDVTVVIINTGLRLGEALHLDWKDVDFDNGQIQICSKECYRIKDRQERAVRMNDTVKALLARKLLATQNKEGPVFSTTGGKFIDAKSFTHRFKVIAQRAGIPWITPQSLRRAFASINAQYMEPFVLQHLMGHSSVQTTQQYYINMGQKVNWIPKVVGG